jgi:glycosyltransferase involved in cell wall biosynthesis
VKARARRGTRGTPALTASSQRPVYSFVIPIFNEEAVLPLLVRRMDRLVEMLDGPAEVIFVDDGSTDTSSIFLADRARHRADTRYLALSRNFGHQVAISAGMDHASGDAIIVLDADLQDPPEVALDMIRKWRDGFDIVYARRLSRAGESRFKTISAALFYRLVNRLASVELPRDVGDYRLVDRAAQNAFNAMREKDRYVRGMFAWMGFRQGFVDFHRPARAAGETRYPLRKMLRLAANGIISFSDAPLRIALWAGMAISMLAMLFGVAIIIAAFTGAGFVPGWSSTIVVTAFLSGINLLMTGVMGLYVGRIHNEVKNRPLYLVGRSIGFSEEAMAGHRGAGEHRATG